MDPIRRPSGRRPSGAFSKPASRFWERGLLGRVTEALRRDLWQVDLKAMSWPKALLVRALRVIVIAVREFERDKCLQQSAALTYLTIFSLPAFLALLFSVAKGFNIYDRLKDGVIDGFLDRTFPTDGGEASLRIREVVDQIFTYVQNADTKVLTTVGLLFIVYAAIKMLSAVEKAFNHIWGVQRARTFVRKLSDYLGIMMVTPIALLAGTAFTGYLQAQRAQVFQLEVTLSPLLRAIPMVSIWLGMSLVLLALPNTRVKLGAALMGGIVGGAIWQVSQYAFLEFQVGLTRLDAIFSSFAAVPLLLSWIYVSWVALFAGCEVAYAFQNEAVVTSMARSGPVDQNYRESLGVRMAGRATHAFLNGHPPPTAAQLSAEIGAAPRVAGEVLELLVQHRLLSREDDDEGYLPARDPETITVLHLLNALRTNKLAGELPVQNRLDERVDRILESFEKELSESLSNYTLRELALTLAEEGEARAPERETRSSPALEGPSR